LIGMGLRQFSMHPSQILEIKQQVVMADSIALSNKVGRLLRSEDPERLREQLEKL
jgi:phosphoenolpyruvate-protein phosphotransferase (PTS system enzyme I)